MGPKDGIPLGLGSLGPKDGTPLGLGSLGPKDGTPLGSMGPKDGTPLGWALPSLPPPPPLGWGSPEPGVPLGLGVCGDYEAGEVSFYNVTDRSHLYTFTETFTEKIWPLFYPGIRAGRRNAAPLSICEPTDWE